MSEKVKLPKEVAEAIRVVRGAYKSNCEFDLEFLKRESFDWMQPIIEYTQESRDNMANYFAALVNGYEVEQTPEDKVREYYNNIKQNQELQAVALRLLDILNIKIEGVNAE